MDQFEEKEITKKRTFGKKHDIPEPVKNSGWCLRKYYESFLKQTQPRIIVNEHVSTMCMGVEKRQENKK